MLLSFYKIKTLSQYKIKNMDTLKMIIFALCIITVIYSIIKKNRLYFNYGYLIIGLLIIVDQIIIYMSSFDPLNLALASLVSSSDFGNPKQITSLD